MVKKVIDIVEFNSISSSGLEICNHLVDELMKPKQTHQFEKKLLKKQMKQKIITESENRQLKLKRILEKKNK